MQSKHETKAVKHLKRSGMNHDDSNNIFKVKSLNDVLSNLMRNYLFSIFNSVGIVQHGGHLHSDKYITFSNIHVHYA